MAGGPSAYMRHVSTAGSDGDLLWTHTTDHADEANFGRWNLDLAEGGTYKLEVYTDKAFAQSTQARYTVHAAGTDHDFIIDQTHADGWQPLGEVQIAAGGEQWLHLSDNTGEPGAETVQLVFDAVRLTRVDPGSGSGSGSGSGDEMMDEPGENGGCSAGGSSGLVIALAALGLRRRRR
ncbi:MAG: hypothetical protein H0T46_14100 [Deltaproteobacteria bacterium]|nr:hypothetical protein [Deltaproteobacteria bacterium]